MKVYDQLVVRWSEEWRSELLVVESFVDVYINQEDADKRLQAIVVTCNTPYPVAFLSYRQMQSRLTTMQFNGCLQHLPSCVVDMAEGKNLDVQRCDCLPACHACPDKYIVCTGKGKQQLFTKLQTHHVDL